MRMTAAQHQRMVDFEAEVEAEMGKIEQEMRDELLSGGYIEIMGTTFGQSEMITHMIELDSDGFDTAVMQVTTGDVQGVRFLVNLAGRAAEQVIGLAKVREEAGTRLKVQEAA